MMYTIRLIIVTYNSQTVFFILSLKSQEFYTPLLYFIYYWGYLRLKNRVVCREFSTLMLINLVRHTNSVSDLFLFTGHL